MEYQNNKYIKVNKMTTPIIEDKFECVRFLETCAVRDLTSCIVLCNNPELETCESPVTICSYAGDNIEYTTKITTNQISKAREIVAATLKLTPEVTVIGWNATKSITFIGATNNFLFNAAVITGINPSTTGGNLIAGTTYYINFTYSFFAESANLAPPNLPITSLCDPRIRTIRFTLAANQSGQLEGGVPAILNYDYDLPENTTICDLFDCQCVDDELKIIQVNNNGFEDIGSVFEPSPDPVVRFDIGNLFQGHVDQGIASCPAETVTDTKTYKLVSAVTPEPSCGSRICERTSTTELNVNCSIPYVEVVVVNNLYNSNNWCACKFGEIVECNGTKLVKYTVNLDGEHVDSTEKSITVTPKMNGCTEQKYDKVFTIAILNSINVVLETKQVKWIVADSVFVDPLDPLGSPVLVYNTTLNEGNEFKVRIEWQQQTYNISTCSLVNGSIVSIITGAYTIPPVTVVELTQTTIQDTVTCGTLYEVDCDNINNGCAEKVSSESQLVFGNNDLVYGYCQQVPQNTYPPLPLVLVNDPPLTLQQIIAQMLSGAISLNELVNQFYNTPALRDMVTLTYFVLPDQLCTTICNKFTVTNTNAVGGDNEYPYTNTGTSTVCVTLSTPASFGVVFKDSNKNAMKKRNEKLALITKK